MKKVLSCLLVAVMLFTASAYGQNPVTKLKRGAINLVTGWIEFPKSIYDTTVEEDIVMGCTMGVVKGIGMGIVRTSAGMYEIMTFPFDIPEGYVAILYPEFVYSSGDEQVVTLGFIGENNG